MWCYGGSALRAEPVRSFFADYSHRSTLFSAQGAKINPGLVMKTGRPISSTTTLTSAMTFFSELSLEDLAVMGRYGITRTYPKNSILINEGDLSDTFFIIRYGSVKVYVSDSTGREVILNILGPGEFFGELALIDESPRSASVATLEPACLDVISRVDFFHCLKKHPDLILKLMPSMCQRIRELTDQVKTMALLDVYGRIIQLLKSLAVERHGKKVIAQRLTHQDIANRVGASREMVSRILKDLVEGGYLEFTVDRQIVLKKKLPPGW